MANQVYCLKESLEAWNMDGSSDAVATRSSWIKSAESATGRKRGLCSFAGCGRPAELGGHVWIRGEGCFLAPICKSCNYYKNKSKQQGAGARLRKNIEVTKVSITAGMKDASRRRYDERASRNKQRGCSRCGRNGHDAERCYASTHVDGFSMSDDEFSMSDDEFVWCCQYCNKEFSTEKGARCHELKWCRARYS